MNEMIQMTERTYYISGQFHVGVYVLDEKDIYNDNLSDMKGVCLIDSGVDSYTAENIDRLLVQNKFEVRVIINTHYHADHAGGNAYFKEKYNCKIMSTKINAALISNYEICPSIVWGTYPLKDITNKYFLATASETENIEKIIMPKGLEYILLPGHCVDMICVKTYDDVLFLGDALVSRETLELHPLSYVYEINDYCESLEKIKDLRAKYYVPYHADVSDNISSLVDANLKCVFDNLDTIKKICEIPRTMDEIISDFYNQRQLTINLYKYALEGSVVRAYVTYLYNIGKLIVVTENNFIKWKTNVD